MTRAVSLFFVLSFFFPIDGAAQMSEVYQYDLSWNGVPAGQATITVVEDGADAATTHVRAVMHTNSFVDLFWSLRANSWGDMDTATLSLQRFEYDRRINGRPEATSITRDSGDLLTGRYARPGRYQLVEINEPGVVDPLTAILRARRTLPAVGAMTVHEVFTGESRYRIQLRRRPSETVVVPAGRFTAVRLEPAVLKPEHNQPDARVHRVMLWVMDRAPHAVVRIRSDVFVGAIYADLRDWSCMGCGK